MVLPNDGSGGMQAQARLLAHGLMASGVDICLAIGGGQSMVRNGVVEIALPVFRARTLPLFALRLWLICRRHRASVLHAHGLRLALVLALFPRRGRIITCHGVDPENVNRRLMKLLHRLNLSVVACGTAPHIELLKWNVPSTIINNAIEPSASPKSRRQFNEYFGVDDEDFVALWPARFSRQKGHDLLLEIFAQIDNPRVKIVCCGDGPLRDEIVRQRDALGLTEAVIIRDYEPNAAGWIAATDYFVLPSRWEGQPLAVLEAAHYRVPIVSMIDVEHVTARMATVHHVAALIRLWAHRGEDYRQIRELMKVPEKSEHGVGIAVAAYLDLYHSRSN